MTHVSISMSFVRFPHVTDLLSMLSRDVRTYEYFEQNHILDYKSHFPLSPLYSKSRKEFFNWQQRKNSKVYNILVGTRICNFNVGFFWHSVNTKTAIYHVKLKTSLKKYEVEMFSALFPFHFYSFITFYNKKIIISF